MIWAICLEETIKPKLKYTFLSTQKRLLSLVVIVTFIFCILAGRLVYLELGMTEPYQILACEQWVRSLPLTAKRGKILDTSGNIMALSQTSYDVYIRAKEVREAKKVAAFLSSLLGLNYDAVYKKAINQGISESLVKLQVSREIAQKIVQSNLDGIYITENISRYYPYGVAACQTIGFLTSDSMGQSGLEKYYDTYLSGHDGKYLTQSDVRGVKLNNSLNYYIDATDGMDLTLNIDMNIQVIAENALSLVMQEQAPKSASVVIMDPLSSKIIAMAISPSYDLNNIPRDDIGALMSMTKNTIVTDVYEPGSTFKILTLAAALSEGVVDLNDHFYCPGYRVVDGQKIKCWKTTGHGDQTLTECVQNSCNCCFMDLAQRLGKTKLYKYLTAFGIGKKSGVDILGESGGILLDIDSVKTVDLVRIGFGQTVAVSQLQLLNAFCSAINGGMLNTPSLLSSIASGGEQNYLVSVMSKNTTISPEVSKTINYLLEQSLSKTGEMTFIPGYRIAGKTGTAQKYGADGQISRGKYVSSFFGYICSNGTPQYALLLCVDEASKGAYYGSVVAKPYAKTIFEQIIEYKNLPPDDSTKTEQKMVVQDYCGLSLSKAISMLDTQKISYEVDGEGGRVVWQFPSPNKQVSKDSTIVLKTN